jgi:DNA-binding MarR family transcriptional regulator
MRYGEFDKNEDLDPVLNFLRLLWRIEHGLQRASKRMETTVGITGPQRLVLRIVGQFPELSAGELAHIIQLHPSTVTGILHRLATRKLLARRRDREDTRRIRLTLMPRARRLTRVTSGIVERAVADTFTRLAPSSIVAAQEVLTAFAGALETLNDSQTREKASSARRPQRKKRR